MFEHNEDEQYRNELVSVLDALILYHIPDTKFIEDIIHFWKEYCMNKKVVDTMIRSPITL